MSDEAATKRLNMLISEMEKKRRPYFEYWRRIARLAIPRRFVRFESTDRPVDLHNPDIQDGVAAIAIRTLAFGMMNGIVSPARPWFRQRVPNETPEIQQWLAAAGEDMLFAMEQTNFYSAIATLFYDLAAFHTAAMIIYEDDEYVFRCYNCAPGEYYIYQNARGIVDQFGRKFQWRVNQIIEEFGEDNVSEQVLTAYRTNNFNQSFTICHVIEPNEPAAYGVPQTFPFREIYWQEKGAAGKVLRARGFNEWPVVVARWDVVGNEDYGVGPSMDALPDIAQLQELQRGKTHGLQMLVNPPIVADVMFQNRPLALLPNGVTFVAGAKTADVRPIYTVNPPFGELRMEAERLERRIAIHYYNDLFRNIIDLQNVRTATEIAERKSEILILIGPVQDRFHREALNFAVKRIFGIMHRNRLFSEAPAELGDVVTKIEYSSIFSDARRALEATPIERGMAFVGNLIGVYPEIKNIPAIDNVVREYFNRIGVSPLLLSTAQELETARAAAAEQQVVQAIPQAAETAQTLAQTPVGGAASALDVILGTA